MSPELIGILSVGAAGLVGLGGVVSINVALYRGLRSDMTAMRSELTAKIDASHSELKSEIAASRSELTAKIDASHSELKSEIAASRSELTAKIDATRGELKAEIDASREDTKALETRMAGLDQGQARLTGAVEVLFAGLGNVQPAREGESAAQPTS